MPVLNESWFTDLDDFWRYADRNYVHGLVIEADSEYRPISNDLTGEQLDRLYTHMNVGTSIVRNALSERYDVDSITASSCPPEVKLFCARMTIWSLETRRLRGVEKPTVKFHIILRELHKFIDEKSPYSLNIPRRFRQAAAFVSSKESPMSRGNFNNLGQFDGIVP